MRLTWQDLDTAARTVYGEARGEPDEGKLAVACVIVQRARKGGWWGNTLHKVCRRKSQFSCWNANDPNLPALLKRPISRLGRDGYIDHVLLAFDLSNQGKAGPVQGCYHYLNPDLVTRMPKWARGKIADVIIGRHHFYRGIA